MNRFPFGIKTVLFTLLFIATITINAQDSQYGSIVSATVNKEFNQWELSSTLELRTIYYLRLVERASAELEADYKINKHFKIGLGYELKNVLDTKYDDYQIRHRGFVSAYAKQKWGDFTFSLREKFQLTTKDDSDRIDSNGEIDTYKMNPEAEWRNRFKVSYDIPHSHFTPAASIETFYQLNNPDGNELDNIRYNVSLSYKINKHHEVELYSIINKELISEDAYGKYFMGIGYTFTIK